ncbi:hypothetical protein H0H81_009089 [Sphagnurus paluster]|uniref:Uncharacterized protein n=1 Tax=Sphagnurus paluster TaxID=117069 RepID=A0A9P7FW05_9AGAR|nr:hypothetical protein H0H81_009089 [Sphagnurus paluster]
MEEAKGRNSRVATIFLEVGYIPRSEKNDKVRKADVLQERRVESNITEACIEHKPLDVYLINTHAFHNAHLIRATLPRDLTAPIPYALDRQSHHDQIAQKLRYAQDLKRAKAKTATKVAEKKAAAAASQNTTTGVVAGSAGESMTQTPNMPAVPSRRKRKRTVQDTGSEHVDVGDVESAMDVTVQA